MAKVNNYCLIYKRIAVYLFSEDSTLLVADWLYSGYIPVLKQGLQLNSDPAATTSIFVEEFLNFCFKSTTIKLDYECKL